MPLEAREEVNERPLVYLCMHHPLEARRRGGVKENRIKAVEGGGGGGKEGDRGPSLREESEIRRSGTVLSLLFRGRYVVVTALNNNKDSSFSWRRVEYNTAVREAEREREEGKRWIASRNGNGDGGRKERDGYRR